MLIVTMLAVGLSVAIAAALGLEQNYREESDVRTTLALQLAYAERYLSLANRIDDVITTNGFGGLTTNFVAFYPGETGGIALETNHWIQVTSNMFFVSVSTNSELVFRIFSGTTNETDRAFSGYGLLRGSRGRVTGAELAGDGAVRRLTLSAEFPVYERGRIRTNQTISVSRPIRLWNSDN